MVTCSHENGICLSGFDATIAAHLNHVHRRFSSMPFINCSKSSDSISFENKNLLWCTVPKGGLQHGRSFTTTSFLSISRKPESKIRTPSKKAAAAKARRKASLVSKEEARLLKLPLRDAISVLRVRSWHFRRYMF